MGKGALRNAEREINEIPKIWGTELMETFHGVLHRQAACIFAEDQSAYVACFSEGRGMVEAPKAMHAVLFRPVNNSSFLGVTWE